VGLESFEHSNVQLKFIIKTDYPTIGESMEISLSLMNTGNSPASLISIEGVVPEGFDILEIPELYRVEGNNIDLRGKRLAPLMTEDIKLVMNPISQGGFSLKPRVQYLDESGVYRTFMSDPVSFDVSKPLKLLSGRCYLFSSHDRCYKALTDYARGQASTLAIIRDDPESLLEKYSFNAKEVYILSSRGIKDYKTLQDLQNVSRTITRSLRDGVDVVLLDGLEYLITRSGFESVFSFLQEMRFTFLDLGGVLLVPLDLEIVDRRERALLQSELEFIT
jgi:hypothetical protein